MSRTKLNCGLFVFELENLSSAFATREVSSQPAQDKHRKFWTVKFSYSYFQDSVQAGLATMPIFNPLLSKTLNGYFYKQ